MASVNIDNMPGHRKAAILMVLLGEEVAGSLLKQLPRKSVSAIAAEVAKVDTIDNELAREVLEQYFLDAVKPEVDRGGREAAKRLLARAEIPPEQQQHILGGRPDADQELLDPLVEAPPESLAALLAEEHPQTAALVLLNLSPDAAAKVLRGMPEEVRSSTVTRMVLLKKVRAELLGEVTSSLHQRLQSATDSGVEEGEADGLERTATILQAMARSEVRTLLEELEREDPERAAQLRDMVYTFDTLTLADDRGIQELLRQVETKALALALHEVEGPLMEKILSNLSERAASMLKEEIEFIGTIKPGEQETAQQEIIQAALKLESEEKLVFAEPDGGEGA